MKLDLDWNQSTLALRKYQIDASIEGAKIEVVRVPEDITRIKYCSTSKSTACMAPMPAEIKTSRSAPKLA